MKTSSIYLQNLTDEDFIKLYYFMNLMRQFENSVLNLYRQGKIVGGVYSGMGNEATAIGSAYALISTDYLFPMHRDSGAHFVKGQNLRTMMLQYLGKADSPTKGRDGSGHYADPKLRIYGNISHLGAMIPVAAGVALAIKYKNENNVVLNYIGEGGSNVGDFHEALAFASVLKLPLVLIIENNQYAYSTPVYKQTIARQFSDRAIGYGIPGVTIDGTDVLEVYSVCKEAIERARRGEGPSIIESVTMRMQGHAAYDDAWYVPKAELEKWREKDPIEKFEKFLLDKNILNKSLKKEILVKIKSEIEDAVNFAINAPDPSPTENLFKVFMEIN